MRKCFWESAALIGPVQEQGSGVKKPCCPATTALSYPSTLVMIRSLMALCIIAVTCDLVLGV